MMKLFLAVFSFSSLIYAQSQTYDVVVIGGGVAGLATVNALADQGIHNVLLLEADPRVGGKMWTERQSGIAYYERGAELVNTSDKELIALMNKLGLGLTERRFKKESRHEILMFKDHQNGGKVRPMTFEELIGKMHQTPGDVEVLKRMHQIQENRSQINKELRKSTARSLVEEGVYTKAFFEALSVSEFGKTLSEMTAEVLMDYARIDKSNKGIFNIEIIPGADEKFRVTGGTDSIIIALEKRVGSKVQKNAVVDTVEQLTASRFRINVKNQNSVIAKHVVFAVPSYQLPKLNIISSEISPKLIHEASELPYAHNAKIFLLFSEKFWNTESRAAKSFQGVGILESGVQFWDTTEDQTKSKEGVITLYPGEWPADQKAQEKRLQEIIAELRQVPGLEKIDQYLQKVDAQNWVKSYAGAFSPSQAQAIKLFGRDLPINMYFVGADKDNNAKGEITESFGYMNGAVRTALRATQLIKAHTRKMCEKLF
jgi:monoamine oxidase